MRSNRPARKNGLGAARHPIAAAAYIESHARELDLILDELGGSAAAVARFWATAVKLAATDPMGALGALADAEVRLNHGVRLELSDSLRVIRAAMDRFDHELPDPEAEESP